MAGDFPEDELTPPPALPEEPRDRADSELDMARTVIKAVRDQVDALKDQLEAQRRAHQAELKAARAEIRMLELAGERLRAQLRHK